MNGPVVKAHVAEVAEVPVSRPLRSSPWTGLAAVTTEPVFGMALIDRRGNLLGAGTARDLVGEVAVPAGVDLRKEDLRPYLDGGLDGGGCRRFPLVSATWVQVRSKRVRVGIYMERGETFVSPERLELDLGRIAAILSNQLVA